jgi:1-acyl-sn-glycerol-3-phosphate acyltransferase
MEEAAKVVKMKPRTEKAPSRNRTNARNRAVKEAAHEVVDARTVETLVEAKVEERLTALERRLARSLSNLESKLEQALAEDHRPEKTTKGQPWELLLSTLEEVVPMADVQPLVGDLVASAIEQLEKLGVVQLVRETLTNVLNHTSLDVDEFGYDQEFEDKLRPLLEFLFYTWWRVEMSGVENIPATGRALLVSNHSGTLPYDGAMIKFGVRELHSQHRILRALMHDMFNSLPLLGPVLSKLGCVRACQENGIKLLERDHATMVFPEGAKGTGKYFRNRYKLERFGRGGFVQLAARTSSPIVPIAVVGAEEIHPILQNSTVVAKFFNLPYFPLTPTWPWLGVLGLIPLPSKWHIEIGEPIRFNHLSPKELEDDFLMDHLGNEVRLAIQRMIDERLKQRRSIWFG